MIIFNPDVANALLVFCQKRPMVMHTAKGKSVKSCEWAQSMEWTPQDWKKI